MLRLRMQLVGTEKPRVQTSRVSALTLSRPAILVRVRVPAPVALHLVPVVLSRPLHLPSTLCVLANRTQVPSRRREKSFSVLENLATSRGIPLTVPTASLSAPQIIPRSLRSRTLPVRLLVASFLELALAPMCLRSPRRVAASPLATACSLVITLTRELTLCTLALPNPLTIPRRLLCILTRVRRTLGLPIIVTRSPISLRRVRVRVCIALIVVFILASTRSTIEPDIAPLKPPSRPLHLPCLVATRVLVSLSREWVVVSRALTSLSSPVPTLLTPLRPSRIRISPLIRLSDEMSDILFPCRILGIRAPRTNLESLHRLVFLWSIVIATKVPTPRSHLTTEGAR